MSARAKILLVDHDDSAIAYVKAKLGERYEIIATRVPGEAFALARLEVPDLILLDVKLQGIDPYRLCQRIVDDPQTGQVPVIFIAEFRDGNEEARGFESGAVDYIPRRSDRGVLEARLRNHLLLGDARRALRDQNMALEAKVAQRTAELSASREALREAMHNLRTTHVSTGVYWVQVPEAGLYILCGSPADVVKHLMLRGYIAEETRNGVRTESGPNVILLSDVLVQNGRFANLAEFPVLQMLYRQGMILPGHPNNTGMKPVLVGSRAQVRAQLDYILRGNYGLATEAELRAAGLTEEEARQEMALKLAFAFGRIRPSEELLDCRVVEGGPVEIANGVSVRRVGLNRFEFAYRAGTTQVDLNLAAGEHYEAPYAAGQHEVEKQYFGVIHSGQGDGWDVRRQSMGSIVMFQGRYYLVDAGPGILDTLQSLGIDVGEVEGIFHTHAHDDHFAGLPSLLACDRPLKYFATPLVRHSVAKKLAALTDIDERLFAELFEVHDLEVDRWNDCDGMEVMPIASPHPVESTVFFFRAHDEEGYQSYAHWADIVSFEVLQRLRAHPVARDVLPADFAERVRSRYHTPATVKKIDAGGGLIHGEPLDFLADRSGKIILAHRATSFSREQLEVGSEAVFGAVDVLIRASQDFQRQRATELLRELFPDARISELNALLRAPVVGFNAGSLMLRKGTVAQRVHLLLGGSVELLRSALQAPLVLAPGALLGAQALFEDGPLADSWRATSPVRVMSIGVEAMRIFLRNGGWYERYRTLLLDTEFVRSTRLLGERIRLVDQGRIARAMQRHALAAGASLSLEGAPAVWLVRAGEVVIAVEGRMIERVGPGGFVGEWRCLNSTPPGWRVTAPGSAELCELPWESVSGYPVIAWKLLESLGRRRVAAELASGADGPA